MIMLLQQGIRWFAYKFGYDIVKQHTRFRDFEEEEVQLVRSIKHYTMTSPERIFALIHAVKYVVNNDIPGAIVECGVWRGGSMMAVAKTLLNLNHLTRELYLFDTFEGMPKPSDVDMSDRGIKASDKFEKNRINDNSSRWAYATLDETKKAMYSVGYDKRKIHFIKGKVEETIPDKAPDVISLLRLDTDFYESTIHELIHLFPRLSKHGILIIDDYGSWMGAKKAVDTYIAQNNLCLYLNRIDNTGRLCVKI